MNLSFEKIRRELFGEPISPGVVVSKALLFKQIELDSLEINGFAVSNISAELERLDLAIEKSRDQLSEISRRLGDESRSQDVSQIFAVQMQFIEDKSFINELKQKVRSQKRNIEHVIAAQMKIIESRFSSINDDILKTKFLDVKDVYHRILRNLLEIEHVRTNPMQRIDSQVIFVSEKLVPSDVALLDLKKIQGIIIEEGSRVSHIAVISKSLGIPAVINVPGAGSLIRSGDQVILDAYTGRVLIHPSLQDLSVYHEKHEHLSLGNLKRNSNINRFCETRDGLRIRLEANISSIREAEIAMACGADGIGLLRSELFYISCAHQPSVQEEIDFYRRIIAITKRKPLSIRLLDLGADKTLPFLHSHHEENPQLGNRGLRYLFRYPDLFTRHLKCVLSICRLAHIKIALPFVSTLDDYEKAHFYIQNCCNELKLNREALRIGIMVEIPAVALSIKSFVPKVDFFNIGTNDLVQYIFAASREDANLDDYRQSMHPVILRLIRSIVTNTGGKEKEVSVCGEMASNPMMAGLLIGAGVTTFSMQPASIPLVKKFIMEHSFSDLQRLFQKAVAMDKIEEVNLLLKKLTIE